MSYNMFGFKMRSINKSRDEEKKLIYAHGPASSILSSPIPIFPSCHPSSSALNLLAITVLDNIMLITMACDLPSVFTIRATRQNLGAAAAVHTARLVAAAVSER